MDLRAFIAMLLAMFRNNRKGMNPLMFWGGFFAVILLIVALLIYIGGNIQTTGYTFVPTGGGVTTTPSTSGPCSLASAPSLCV